MMSVNEAREKLNTEKPALPPPPMTILQYSETVQDIRRIILAKEPTPANTWQMVFAASLEHKCGIPMDKSIANFQSTDKVIEHYKMFSDWENQYRQLNLLNDAINYFENLVNMNMSLDRMVSDVYKYNFKMSEDAIRKFEGAIDKQLSDLEDAVSPPQSSEPADDDESEHAEGTYDPTEGSSRMGVRMGAPMVHEIVCDPPKPTNTTTYRWELECEKRPPIASTKFVWELSCDENRKVPHLLLAEIKNIRDQAAAYSVNNFTDGDKFIENIKGFQKKLLNFASVAYSYINAPPFDRRLATYAPRMSFVFENYMEQAYLYVMELGRKVNPAMYNIMSSMTYSAFLTTLLDGTLEDRSIAHHLINYVCYKFKGVANTINTKTFNFESNTTIYFNGNTVKTENKGMALRELTSFSRSLSQNQQAVSIWTLPNP